MFNRHTLETLWLHGNQISDVSALAKALETNTTLEKLSLRDNQISDEDKKKLEAVWEKTRGNTSRLFL